MTRRALFYLAKSMISFLFIMLLLYPAQRVSAEEAPPPDVKEAGPPPVQVKCPVSGAKLGAMGEPAVYLHEGREIRFCCPGCIETFKKDPAKYLKNLDGSQEDYHHGHDHDCDHDHKTSHPPEA